MWILLLILVAAIGALGIILRSVKEGKEEESNQADGYEIIEDGSNR